MGHAEQNQRTDSLLQPIKKKKTKTKQKKIQIGENETKQHIPAPLPAFN